MAIICARAEGEHERVLREFGPLYVLEPVFVKALQAGTFAFVKMIDPYGDTIFNHLQLRDFLDEWDRLARFATSDPEKKALTSVKQLAEYCLEAPHRYLRFYGD